ncbi:right-handed parallel beta-helix repeat-containing protein [Opitutaceae bacterium]|nr:right-handed parallel beta-helix repeat-containing protein [Opitutaceae bacterium]
MKKSLHFAAIVWLATSLSAKTINVADHGITPGHDVTMAMNTLVESIKDQKDITLFFPRGQYEFYPENAVEHYRAIANHDNSLKRIAFPLFDMDGLTLDGDGSTFIFRGRMSPVVVDGSSNITLRNFPMDWEQSFIDKFRVVARDVAANSFVVEPHTTDSSWEFRPTEILFNRHDWQDQLGSNIIWDPSTKAPIWDTRPYNLNSSRPNIAESAGPNRIRFTGASQTPPPVDTILVTYGRHPTSRLAQAIHLSQADDTLIENVTVHAAGGMALIAERCDNVTLNGFKVTSSEHRHVATRADATHFIGCKGVIKLENCLLEHMLDDGINVHGAYIKIEKILDGNRLLCEISHFQQWGLDFAEPGDHVMITDRTTVLPIKSANVTAVEVLNEHRLIVTVDALPAELPDRPLSLENLTWYPNVIMRNNTIRDNRARSALITTKGKVLIENNTFSSQMHGILIEGDNNKWYESGAVEDVTIRNNIFENIGYGDDFRYPLFAAPLLTDEQHFGEGRYHRNIHFVDNVLKSFNGHIAYAQSVEGLHITRNTIELSKDYPNGSSRPAIDLLYAKDVVIENNRVVGFDQNLKVRVSGDSENISVQKNDGLKR